MSGFINQLHIYPDAAAAAQAVAREIAELVQAAPKTVLGLATGNTQRDVYKELVRLYRQLRFSFKDVTVFNLDEYYPMERDSQHSFFRYMQQHLFRHIDINPANCHIPLGTYGSNTEIENRCDEYEGAIWDKDDIDYQLLGIGPDGHFGFNSPGTPNDFLTHLARLTEIVREAAVPEFGALKKVPQRGITMGPGTILRARRIALLATGEHKAEIICNALVDQIGPAVPASYLREHGNAAWHLDEAAAAKLPATLLALATYHPALGGGRAPRGVALQARP